MATKKGAKDTLDHHVKTLAQLKTQDQENFCQDEKTKKAGSQSYFAILYWLLEDKIKIGDKINLFSEQFN